MRSDTDCRPTTRTLSGRTLTLLIASGLTAQAGMVAAEAECTDEQVVRMIQNDLPQDVIDEVCGDVDIGAEAAAEDDTGSGDDNITIKIDNQAIGTVEGGTSETADEMAQAEEPEAAAAEPEEDSDDTDQEARRTFIGGGMYSLGSRVDPDSGPRSDIENFNGPNIVLRQAFHPNWSGEVGYYSIEHEDHSDWDLSGLVINLWLSTNAYEPGWIFGIGGGLYTEDWGQETYDGFQFGILLGYRWENFGVEIMTGGRDTSDQEDAWGGDADIVHSMASLNVLYQF